ncbi:hypothetical protein ACJ3XI_10640 [Litorimonas sp. RW-G-Af-16]|uniref:hypothetical protein n=1 Tax=Litorimonas sp. RW-G-Af-16 TaxID=3241168 RepID=UPI00390C527E
MLNVMKTCAIAGATALAMTTTAFAADSAAEFTMKRTTNAHVKMSVKAFKKGDYERAVRFSETALTKGLSESRQAIVQSNLCASYAMLNDTAQAAQACAAALALNPELEEAKANQTALNIRLVENK